MMFYLKIKKIRLINYISVCNEEYSYILWTPIDLMKENGLTQEKARSK